MRKKKETPLHPKVSDFQGTTYNYVAVPTCLPTGKEDWGNENTLYSPKPSIQLAGSPD